mgnify:CR=1 FL=1
MAHISGWPTHGVDNAGPILANQAMVDHHAPVPKDKIGLIDEFIIGFCEELEQFFETLLIQTSPSPLMWAEIIQ